MNVEQRPPEGSDTIAVTGITATGFHGVFEHERTNGQQFVVDVLLYLDLQPAAVGDDLTRTVHYGDLAERVHALIAGEPRNLIETLAENIAQCILDEFPVGAIDVTVHKPAAPINVPFADVAVSIHRRQR